MINARFVRWLALELIRQGRARADRSRTQAFQAAFEQAGIGARRKRLGLWAVNCPR